VIAPGLGRRFLPGRIELGDASKHAVVRHGLLVIGLGHEAGFDVGREGLGLLSVAFVVSVKLPMVAMIFHPFARAASCGLDDDQAAQGQSLHTAVWGSPGAWHPGSEW
jgi:hypothetical protein